MDRAPMDDDKKPSQNDHGTRITALERAMTGVEAEIRQLRQHMNDGFALLRDAIGEIVKRLDRQDDRMDRFDTRMDRLETRVDRLETRMDARFDQMASLLRWAIGLLVAVLIAMLGAGVSLVGLFAQHLH
jgi:septal ring factor EnvC (AmiA/AmiB activator)